MYSPYNFQIPTVQKQEIVKVNGKGGVDAFQLPPDSSALLLDTSAPIVWLVQTDGAGYKTCVPYDIAPHKTEEEVAKDNYKALEERIARLEETINAKSNVTNAKRKSEYNDEGIKRHDERSNA